MFYEKEKKELNMMKKFQNPCNYGIDPETTKEELVEYVDKLEDIRKRRNKQIKILKKEIKNLKERIELYRRNV